MKKIYDIVTNILTYSLEGEVFWLAYFDSQIRKSITWIYNLEYKGFDIQLRIPSPMTFETCICSNSTLRYLYLILR